MNGKGRLREEKGKSRGRESKRDGKGEGKRWGGREEEAEEKPFMIIHPSFSKCH